jgi:CheY-like chemotaxis protein
MSLVGNLEDLGLGEILQIVSLSRKSGVLYLHSRGREARIVFRSGQVIRASSSSFQQNLGEVLIQKGIIDLPTLKKSLAAQQEGGSKELLGSILIKQFGASADAIESVVREQIESVVYSLFAWAEGAFEFQLQDVVEATDNTEMNPVQFMLEQGLNPQFLAMEGSRIIDEQRHRGELDGSYDEFPTAALASDDSEDLFFDIVHNEEASVSTPPIQEHKEKQKIVLVDDDITTREVLTVLLSEEGYEVSQLEKSEDALILVDTMTREGERPLVLLDLILPNMDGTGMLGGLELLDLLNNNFKEVPVLLLADYHNRDAERKIRSMGFALIMKPPKSEIRDESRINDFKTKLFPELVRVMDGGGAVDWNRKINLGDEIRFEMGEEPSATSQPIVQSTGISLLRGMLDELNNPSLGGGIILLVLRFASEFMNRAVVLYVKKDEISGLGQFGIDDKDGLADTKIRELSIPRNAESLFSKVIDSQAPRKSTFDKSEWNNYFVEKVGGTVPFEFFVGPIVSEGKVVALLYGDNLPDQKPIGDTDSLEIFLSQAGIAMEKALLQRRLKDKGQEGL